MFMSWPPRFTVPFPARRMVARAAQIAALTVACNAGPETSGSGGRGEAGGAGGGTGGDAQPASSSTASAGGASASAGAAGGGGEGDGGEAAGGAGAGGAGGTVGSGGAAGSGGGGSGGTGPLPNITIWLAGDSTVANGQTPCPAGWGGQLAALFDDRVTVVNSAAGGRSVRTWLYEVQTTMDSTGECALNRDASGEPVLQDRWARMLDGMKGGDYLFIQFGINDGSRTCDRHVGLDAFKSSYGMMARAAQERGAQPVFVTPVSAIACDGSVARGTRGGYVTATHEAGAEHGVPVIDLHEHSVRLYNELGFCPVPGGDVSATTGGPVGEFFCDDHTHFARSGAAQIAGLVAGAIRDQELGLAAYLE
ncbi:GDSL-type esterase/lipase family protein [Sorangium sp. So ce1335]|uniref:GDSL-type esterase/lipase family protein n=1 Tax=Sorangium sp. So ce1335 TaxID=3133335 RepID=UPI003F60E90A